MCTYCAYYNTQNKQSKHKSNTKQTKINTNQTKTNIFSLFQNPPLEQFVLFYVVFKLIGKYAKIIKNLKIFIKIYTYLFYVALC